ncbi:MAG TPA: sulfite oxidase-like oxidoreductase, partial [Anaerolineaceae bacterium]|nr:sulfite oxidase-like oxidoreductase [Anaerolineaceae bacterium]
MFDRFFGRPESSGPEDRVPPGQALTSKFPVLHYGPIPRFDPETWDFRVWGEVESPLRLSWEE